MAFKKSGYTNTLNVKLYQQLIEKEPKNLTITYYYQTSITYWKTFNQKSQF